MHYNSFSQYCPTCYSSFKEEHIFENAFVSGSRTFSSQITSEGFEDFFLGTDVGEPYIVTNPIDPLNSACIFIGSVYITVDGCNWRKTNTAGGDPFICFDGLGNLYFIRYNGINALNLNKSTNKGISWMAPTPIHNSSAIDKWSIISDKTTGPFSNNLYCAWAEWVSNSYFLRLKKSTNGGANWSTFVNLNSNDNCYCPWIAIGPNGSIQGGSLYYAFNIYNENLDTFYVVVRRSTDAGTTFQPEVRAAQIVHPGELCNSQPFRLKNCVTVNACVQIAADNGYSSSRGNVYIVYTGNPPGIDKADIYFTRSTDNGANWSGPVKLNDDNTTADQWLPAISVDNNGKVYATWYDSRFDVLNVQTKLYVTVSTDGGITFAPNTPVSMASFNPNVLAPVFSGYLSDYMGNSPIGNTTLAAWMDGRNNHFDSYVGYYPDFAMKIFPEQRSFLPNDSILVTIKVPATNGTYNDKIRFSARIDTMPANGTIECTFPGPDSITSVPDSVYMKIKTSGVTNPRTHRIIIKGYSMGNQVPVHERIFTMQVTIGIIQLSEEIPDRFSLSQNYPNPFNPVTNINFDLPFRSNVKLSVFDIQGKEIKVLVNNKLEPAPYRVEFDGSNLPSGVYFYKLETEDYTEAKKMVLVK